jgi:hypothetical protein
LRLALRLDAFASADPLDPFAEFDAKEEADRPHTEHPDAASAEPDEKGRSANTLPDCRIHYSRFSNFADNEDYNDRLYVPRVEYIRVHLKMQKVCDRAAFRRAQRGVFLVMRF